MILKMKAVRTSEALMYFNETTQRLQATIVPVSFDNSS
jgi:hypothetical protein